MFFQGIIPCRLLVLAAHLVCLITIMFQREMPIKLYLPSLHTDAQYQEADLQLLISLSVGIGLFLVELIGFFSGASMFSTTQNLISIIFHGAAPGIINYIILYRWNTVVFWYVFAFSSCLPALTELITISNVLCCRGSR